MTESTAAVAAAGPVLTNYDFIIGIDKSGSMGTEDCKGKSRWQYVQETACQFARELSKIDSDGLGLVMFGGAHITKEDGVDANRIADAFAKNRPSGSTPLAEGLTACLELAGKSDKKDFIIIFTDGEPDDRAAAKKVIIDAANKQDTDDALTILFIQVGNDAAAGKYLAELDDNLKEAKFDIVDAKTQAEAEAFPSLTDLILHAIND
jgi:Mg-chelatase subunit ChlD